jgi:hypothetical protein
VRVRTLVAWSGVPVGTEGVIDEAYEGGWMVAWDLPDHPLPAGYRQYDGRPAFVSGFHRDGFAADELHYLEVVR